MTISLLQWNIWYQEDARKVGELLKELNPDIICLQEMTRGYDKQPVGDVANYLAELLGYEVFSHEYTLSVAFGANGIFSRFPISDGRYVWTLPNESPEPRLYVEAKITTPEGYITVGTTHMLYTDHFKQTADKSKETKALAAEISKHNDRYILTGDLNANPGSATIKRVEQYLNNIGPDYIHPTWTTKPFSYHGFEATELKWRLDHCFATPDIKLESSQVINTRLSDHLPIFSTISL